MESWLLSRFGEDDVQASLDAVGLWKWSNYKVTCLFSKKNIKHCISTLLSAKRATAHTRTYKQRMHLLKQV